MITQTGKTSAMLTRTEKAAMQCKSGDDHADSVNNTGGITQRLQRNSGDDTDSETEAMHTQAAKT